jgi:prephenate dehydratase
MNHLVQVSTSFSHRSLNSLAYFGAPGSFHHVAADHFAPDVQKESTSSFEHVFKAVVSGKTDAGLIAIENSIAGSLNDNYDLMLQYDVKVVGEIYLHISHNLLAPAGTNLADITSVYSHPMAIRQCHGFLKSHVMTWHDRRKAY